MDPICLRCEESYSVRDGCDPSTFCDTCAHDIAEYALSLCQLPNVENRCGPWKDVADGVALLCRKIKPREG